MNNSSLHRPIFGLALCWSAACAQSQEAFFSLPSWETPSSLVLVSPMDMENWQLGAYVGRYNHARLRDFAIFPLRHFGDWDHGYMVALDASCSLAHLPHVPLDVELDINVSYHFGEGSFFEFATAPMFRWKWFPWNNLVYTTYRTGPFGASYTTGLSSLEETDTAGGHTTRFLNLYLAEWTFSKDKQAPWEVFLRVHHRSGIYGRIDDVHGGSNYPSVGWRSHF